MLHVLLHQIKAKYGSRSYCTGMLQSGQQLSALYFLATNIMRKVVDCFFPSTLKINCLAGVPSALVASGTGLVRLLEKLCSSIQHIVVTGYLNQ